MIELTQAIIALCSINMAEDYAKYIHKEQRDCQIELARCVTPKPASKMSYDLIECLAKLKRSDEKP